MGLPPWLSIYWLSTFHFFFHRWTGAVMSSYPLDASEEPLGTCDKYLVISQDVRSFNAFFRQEYLQLVTYGKKSDDNQNIIPLILGYDTEI